MEDPPPWLADPPPWLADPPLAGYPPKVAHDDTGSLMESCLSCCHGDPPLASYPPLRDGWLGRSASTLTKRTCFFFCLFVFVFVFFQAPCAVLSTSVGHKDRVNSVRWIKRRDGKPENEFVSASTDKTCIVWKMQGEKVGCVQNLIWGFLGGAVCQSSAAGGNSHGFLRLLGYLALSLVVIRDRPLPRLPQHYSLDADKRS